MGKSLVGKKENILERLGLSRCSTCKSLKHPHEYGKTATGRIKKVCSFCENQKKLESRREHKPKAILTHLRNIDPEIRKVENTLRQQARMIIPKYRISSRISQGIRGSLTKGKGGIHWEKIVGYTINELMSWIEQKFTDGMNWGNYGKWEIDHIVPIASWSFASYADVDFKRCWHYRNLQPLWRMDNLKKNNKLIHQYQVEKMEELKNLVRG